MSAFIEPEQEPALGMRELTPTAPGEGFKSDTHNRNEAAAEVSYTNGNSIARGEPLVLESINLTPDLYFNRELSALKFQERVFHNSLSERHPLLERVKFLAITHSNLDEFFMVRVSGLREQAKGGVSEVSPDGMTPAEELATVRQSVIALFEQQAAHWRESLLPELAKQGIHIADYRDLDSAQKRHLREYFDRAVFPVCTPLAVDPGHPFPHISNLSLNLAVNLRDPDGRNHFARVKVPNVLPRLVPVPGEGDSNITITFVWLEQVLIANLGKLFPRMEIVEAHPFRVVRDADIEIQELEADDLLQTVEESLNRRRFGSAVALFTNPTIPHDIWTTLMENLALGPDEHYPVSGPLGLSDLMEVYRLDRADLKDPSFTPHVPSALRNGDIFTAIRACDILMHHPFDSFAPVVEFIRAAATDPNVLAIKQTLYRVGANSPIVEALGEAAEEGKQVAVLVELKARFDEESNIGWARALEQAGVHVTYGLIGLKTHCKVALVVRKERDGLRRYVHVGTGNYNPGTARGYTDVGMFTCRPEVGADASDLFNYLTGYSKQSEYRRFLVAPVTMREGIRQRITREIVQHRRSGGGHLILKMNSLVDPAIIEDLYTASCEGVKIDLLVRGICCLRPGVTGVSDNIRVISIVGRFLEHSRIYYFRNGGKGEVLIGSADIMPRNLDSRVEVIAPIQDPTLKAYLINEVLAVYLRDTANAHILMPDGSYIRRQPAEGEVPEDAHQILIARATAAETSDSPPTPKALNGKYGRIDTQG